MLLRSRAEQQLVAQRLLREASLELARLRRVRGAYRKTWRRIARARARLAFAAALLAAAPVAEPALALTPRFHAGFSVDENFLDFTYLAHPTFADIDGDADVDLFIGADFFTNLFENTGTPSEPFFGPITSNPFGLAHVGLFHAFADIDGDGDLDAFAGSSGDTVFFANTGTATAPAFGAPSTNPFGLAGVGGFYAAPALADIDGDGDLDLFIGHDSGNTLFFRNTGTATTPAFAAPSTNPFGLAGLGSYVIASPAFADLDGDGDLDAFVGVQDTIFFENTGTAGAPAFAAPSANPFGLTDVGYFVSPAFADVDGDGDLDAFLGGFDTDETTFENTGTATTPAFVATTDPFQVPGGAGSASPAFGDVDGDGDLDALVGDSSGNTRFFRKLTTGFEPFGVSNPFGLADVGAYASPHLADGDADGDLDAFIGSGAGDTVFFANTGTLGTPAFAAPSTNPFGLADVGSYAAPAAADLDGDGDLDVLVGEWLGRTLSFENVLIDPEACVDGLDNDSDGRIDFGNDAGCANTSDTSELSSLQCDNGVDDDGDGKIDWRSDGTGDLECVGLRDDREAPTPPGASCGLGPELLLLAPLLASARRRFRRR